MEAKPVKKTNMTFMLVYIFVPIIVTALSLLLSWLLFQNGGIGAVVTIMGPFVFDAVWYFAGRSLFYNGRRKKLAKELDSQGFTRNYTFDSDNGAVVIDIAHGQIALLFRWNPFEVQVVPASRMGKAWTDDGAFGAGITRGTSRVSFLFTVDQVKVRVNTFTSNQRWKMNDEKVLTGISKADMYVEALNAAKSRSLGG